MGSMTAEMGDYGVPWWLILIEGIALLIVGILFLATPGTTSVIAVQLLGIYWLIAGVLKIVQIFLNPTGWGWKLLAGLLGIIAGILILQHPVIAPLVAGSVLVIVLGIEGILIGIANLVDAFRGAGWGTAALGVISILLGVFLLANLGQITLSLPWVLGILGVVGGIVVIILAFRMRRSY